VSDEETEEDAEGSAEGADEGGFLEGLGKDVGGASTEALENSDLFLPFEDHGVHGDEDEEEADGQGDDADEGHEGGEATEFVGEFLVVVGNEGGAAVSGSFDGFAELAELVVGERGLGLDEEHVGGGGDDAAAGAEAVDGGEDTSGDAGFDDTDDMGVTVAIGDTIADVQLGGVGETLVDDEGQVQGWRRIG